MKKYYLFILFLISFNLVSAQLSPQSKKITEKFFKEYEEHRGEFLKWIEERGSVVDDDSIDLGLDDLFGED